MRIEEYSLNRPLLVMRVIADEWHGLAQITGALMLAGVLGASAAQAGERFSDPTRPPDMPTASKAAAATAASSRPLELQAILHAAGRRVAIINGRRVHENEQIENALIRSIEKDRVRLTRGGNDFELSLAPKSIKTTGSASKRIASPVPAAPAPAPTPAPTTTTTTSTPKADTLGRLDGKAEEGTNP